MEITINSGPMARVTIEDCLEQVDNRFALVHLTSSRVRQIKKGSRPLIICKNKEVVVALREIASGQVGVERGAIPDPASTIATTPTQE